MSADLLLSRPVKTREAYAPARQAGCARTDPEEAAALTKVLRSLEAPARSDLEIEAKIGAIRRPSRSCTAIASLRVWSEPVQEFRNEEYGGAAIRLSEPGKVALAVTELTRRREDARDGGGVAERVDVRFEQQVWKNGLRLYGGETRALQRRIIIKAEVVSKTWSSRRVVLSGSHAGNSA